MNQFDKEYKNEYLKYHHNPISPNSLDPRVWYYNAVGDPVLQPEIKAQIINDINQINSSEEQYNKTRIWDYFMVGPTLQENSSGSCSINIVTQISTANLHDMVKENILRTIKDLNGRMATGTTHPIHYIPTIRDFDTNDYMAVYHPYTERWIKKPRFLGEKKCDLENIGKDIIKKRPKHSTKKGIKKLGTI